MIPYIPPELTDTIIHYCATGLDAYPSVSGLSSQTRSTLLACSLVCRDWYPASRSLAFSSIALKCTPGEIRSLMDVATSPNCSFRNFVRSIKFIVPHGKPGVYKHENVSQHMLSQLLKCLRPKSIIIEGDLENGLEKPRGRKPVLIREQLLVALKDTFLGLGKAQVIPPITSLTLSSLLFENFSDATLLLRSLPEIEYLGLYDLAYVAPSVPWYPPLQKLKNVHIHGRRTPSLMVLWLITVGKELMSPIQEFKMSNVSEVVDVQHLSNYFAASRGVLERFEIEFTVEREEEGTCTRAFN